MPIEAFREAYGQGPSGVARAPGRVNLIGDHTDYNGGFVLPMAIDRDIRIAFEPSDDGRVELVSVDFDGKAIFDLKEISREKGPAWARYPMGVAAMLQSEGYGLRGFRGVVKGDVPIGAGLSSSAAFEVVSALVFCNVSDLKINREKLAKICQRAENEFVGMRCGIMDQFASLLSRKGHALFIDCATLSYDLIRFDDRETKVVVCDTRVQRELVKSPYNERRRECAKAFKLLQRHSPKMETYRDMTVEFFRAYAGELPEVIRRRARHVVTEDMRVLHAVEALKRGDLLTFGTLMDASHESLRDDFEVSCRELDLLVDLAREAHGTYGARLTGGGFGGCTVSLVEAGHVEGFVTMVSERYKEETGRAPGVYVFRPSDGATIESGTAT